MNNLSIFKRIAVFFTFLMLLSCSYTKEVDSSKPQIRAGIATIHGKLDSSLSQTTSVTLSFENPVTAKRSFLETKLKEDGSFYFETPVECSVVLGTLYIDGHGGLIELFSDEDINVECELNSDGKIKINNLTKKHLLTDQDKEQYADVFTKFDTYYLSHPEQSLLNMTLDEYAHYELNLMDVKTNYAMESTTFSNVGKDIILNEFKLFYLYGFLLPYVDRIKMLYSEEDLMDFRLQEPDTEYYKFLKSFNLNNPQYMYNIFFSGTMQRILSRNSLNIPLIADTSIDEWLINVKGVLSPLIGFDSGQFYDILSAHAYTKQFVDEIKPLSNRQIENIKKYFKGNKAEIAKILFRKNEEIIQLAALKDPLVVINETPTVLREKLMEEIVSRYKGNVVVVDFWATWCGPCLGAMERFKTVKDELYDKNVVFVYLTNHTSPQKTWRKKIKDIGGEHYYLTGEEWESISFSDKYGFEGIPTYLVFDKNGELKHKITSYPGNEEMRKKIEELLP